MPFYITFKIEDDIVLSFSQRISYAVFLTFFSVRPSHTVFLSTSFSPSLSPNANLWLIDMKVWKDTASKNIYLYKLEGQWPWIPRELEQFVDEEWSILIKKYRGNNELFCKQKHRIWNQQCYNAGWWVKGNIRKQYS